MKKILVPVDGSQLSPHLINAALDYAKTQESKVTLLNVIHLDTAYFGETELSKAVQDAKRIMYEESKKSATKILDEQAKKLEENNITVEKSVKSGKPADVILKTAESEQYDLIIIGNQGYTLAEDVFLGSVSRRVLAGAKCPVLVVKKH